MNLTYEIVEGGYYILKDGKRWMAQIGIFPYEGATVEESAQNHMKEIMKENENPTVAPPDLNEIEEIKAQNAQIILALVQGGLM